MLTVKFEWDLQSKQTINIYVFYYYYQLLHNNSIYSYMF
jgi:hypothetical protein